MEERIYSDLNLEQLETIPDEALHRPVDLLFLNADKEGQLKLPGSLSMNAN